MNKVVIKILQGSVPVLSSSC